MNALKIRVKIVYALITYVVPFYRVPFMTFYFLLLGHFSLSNKDILAHYSLSFANSLNINKCILNVYKCPKYFGEDIACIELTYCILCPQVMFPIAQHLVAFSTYLYNKLYITPKLLQRG